MAHGQTIRKAKSDIIIKFKINAFLRTPSKKNKKEIAKYFHKTQESSPSQKHEQIFGQAEQKILEGCLRPFHQKMPS
jgi:hypothetical protein